MNTKTFLKWLLYVSVGLSGVILAASSIISSGIMPIEITLRTIFFLMLTDAFIVFAILSKHVWLKYAVWVTAALAFLVNTVSTLMTARTFAYLLTETEASASVRLWSLGLYLIAFGLCVAVAVSLMYPALKRIKLTGLYAFAQVTGISAFVLAGAHVASGIYAIWLPRLYFALVVLSATVFTLSLIAFLFSLADRKKKPKAVAPQPGYVPQPYQHQPMGYAPHPAQPVQGSYVTRQPAPQYPAAPWPSAPTPNAAQPSATPPTASESSDGTQSS